MIDEKEKQDGMKACFDRRINDKVDCNEKVCWVSNIRFTTL